MDAIAFIRRMWEHAAWADALLCESFRTAESPLPEAWREYSHILGAEEVWLSRLEQRAAHAAVWPELTLEEGGALREGLVEGYRRFLAGLTEAELNAAVEYTNSAGQRFATPVCEILTHVALHGQYHRGKVNLMLRNHGAAPVPTDYISFVRGVPAAVTPRR